MQNYELEDQFAIACSTLNLEEIKRLAPQFDLNRTRFKYYTGRPSPLIAALSWSGNTSALELLLSLGAIPNSYDAVYIKMINKVDVQLPEW